MTSLRTPVKNINNKRWMFMYFGTGKCSTQELATTSSVGFCPQRLDTYSV